MIRGTYLNGLTPEKIRNLSVNELSIYNVEALKFTIIPSGIDLNRQNSEGKTLLHIYVEKGYTTHVEKLLQHDVDEEIEDHCGKLPRDSVNDLIFRNQNHRSLCKYKRIKKLLVH